MFTVYHSNDIELLVKLGIHLMKSSDSGSAGKDPFTPKHVIVQSNGMETYLKQKIAETEGVCARIECQLPWRFIWSLHDGLFPDEYPHEMVYNADNIAWILLQAFTEGSPEEPDCFNPEKTSCRYPYVADYIYDKSAGSDTSSGTRILNRVKCYRLASRLASVYENYLVYRQDWIRSWSDMNDENALSGWLDELKRKHHTDFNDEDYKWIASLWREFIQNNLDDELKGKDRIHYMDSMKEILLKSTPEEFLARLEKSGRDIPKDIYVYGISSVAPVVLEFLVLLGRFINVHFMFTNPCRYYWGDIKAHGAGADDGNIDAILEKIKQRHGISLNVKNRNITGSELEKITGEHSFDTACDREYSGPDLKKDYYEKSENDTLELVDSNRLLLTYGKAGKDTISSIMAYSDNDDCQINDIHAFVENEVHTDGNRVDSLLNLIKNDILNMSFTPMQKSGDETADAVASAVSKKERRISLNDHSIEFHSCITPLREVQVLYDHILEKFKNDRNLRPRDIAVFMPNVAKYAPYIDAVFGTNRELLTKGAVSSSNITEGMSVSESRTEELPKINLPYSICDRTTAEECPEIDGFNKLMSLASGEIDNESLFMLLSIEAIRARFGIEAEDLVTVKKWFNENNIIFGLDEADTADYSAKKDMGSMTDESGESMFVSDYRNSFKSGIDRLLTGSLMPVLPEGDDDHVYNTGLEGSDSFELLGHLYAFYEALRDLRKEFRKCNEAAEGENCLPKDIQEKLLDRRLDDGEIVYDRELDADKIVSGWHDFVISRVLNRFFVFGEDNINLYLVLARHFDRMKTDMKKLKNIPKITLDVIREYLSDKLTADTGFSAFLRDRVNFCSFIPMRAIPFKHIFMLGMNDGEYPKADDGDYFDLMKTYFRQGDRSRRNDDCYMFMEAMISAGESLYISFIGRDVVKNSELNPSMLVNELLNYIVSSCMLDRESFEMAAAMDKDEAFKKSYDDYETDVDSVKTEDFFRKALIRTESMNVYDRSNFEHSGRRLRSYQAQWCPHPDSEGAREDKVLWKDFISPELSNLKFVRKDENTPDMFTDCEYFLDVTTDDLEEFFRLGDSFFVKDVLRLSKYILNREKLIEHENWQEQYTSDLKRYVIRKVSGQSELSDDLIERTISEYIKGIQEKGILANGNMGEYYKKLLLDNADGKSKIDMNLLKSLIEIDGFLNGGDLISVPVDRSFKVKVERRFIDDSEIKAPCSGREAKSEHNSETYVAGEQVNVEVRVHGNIDGIVRRGSEYLLVDINFWNSFVKSLFQNLYKAELLYLELAGAGGEAHVGTYAFTKENVRYMFAIDFDGNKTTDDQPKIVGEYDESVRKVITDKFEKILNLYIKGHFAYVPYGMITGVTSKVFSIQKEQLLNAHNNNWGGASSDYVSESRILFGGEEVNVLEFNKKTGSLEDMYGAIDWLVEDSPFLDKFTKGIKGSKSGNKFLDYPTDKEQIKKLSELTVKLKGQTG